MKQLFISLFFCFYLFNANAQEYKIYTDQTDSFSVALVKLLQCGINKFEACKGNHLQYTIMQEDEYELTIPFPNSIAGIVRYRDWDKNAYVEFGPFKDNKEMAKALKQLHNKVKKALGKQLRKDDFADSVLFYSMSIADENGHFQSSFEFLTGTTAEESYLLSKQMGKGNADQPKHNFILLKVQGGIPAYYHAIPSSTKPADEKLYGSIKLLMQDARTDFDSLHKLKSDSKKGTDTLQFNGSVVYYYKRGGNRSALIRIPTSTDPIVFAKQLDNILQTVKAAAGDKYLYHTYRLDNRSNISFFVMNDQALPTIYIQQNSKWEKEAFIDVRVQSRKTHAVKRSASFNDEDY